MPKYKLTISYDGTPFGGWQSQQNSVSIQDLIERALEVVLRKKTPLHGSGRTDAGVHALGQIAHFSCGTTLDVKKVVHSLNALLQSEIRILEMCEVDPTFHARFSAKSKIYHYRLHLNRIADPFKRQYALHVLHKVDLDRMKKAIEFLTGTHDFSSFANQQHEGSAAKDAVRHLKRIDVVEEIGGVRLEFEGSGFLYKMVRNITGTLLEVASGKREPESLKEILLAKDRTKAGRTIDPHGLYLVKVLYD